MVRSGAPPAFVVEVEKRADEIVRAAEARHLDGPTCQGAGEGVQTAYVPGGMFLCLTVPRHECVYGNAVPSTASGAPRPPRNRIVQEEPVRSGPTSVPKASIWSVSSVRLRQRKRIWIWFTPIDR